MLKVIDNDSLKEEDTILCTGTPGYVADEVLFVLQFCFCSRFRFLSYTLFVLIFAQGHFTRNFCLSIYVNKRKKGS